MKAMVATVILAAAAAVIPPNGSAQAGSQAVSLTPAVAQERAAASRVRPSVSHVAAAPVLKAPETYSDISAGALSTHAPSTQGAALSLFNGPAPSVAWIFALAFLGLVIFRRTRSSAAF